MADIVSRAGADFAFPSQTLYTKEAGDPDPAKSDAASAVVKERIDNGTLCIPEIPEHVAKQLEPDPEEDD